MVEGSGVTAERIGCAVSCRRPQHKRETGAFTGKLDEIQVPDLLQIISAGQKSGTLRLTRREGNAIVAFRSGRIIYAASSSVRETLGSLLLSRKLIGEKDLMDALEAQRKASEERRLGTILVDRGFLSQEALEELVGEQVERVVKELLDWRSGFFQFDLLTLADHGEVEVDARGFLLREGLSPDGVLIRVAGQIDALERQAAPAPPASPPAAPPPAPKSAAPAPAAPKPAPPRPAPQVESPSLRSVMTEIRSPEFTGELTIKIMSFAAGLVERGVLFYVRRGHFCGMGQFGIELTGGSADAIVREIKVPLGQPSVLQDVAARKASFQGPLPATEWNRNRLAALGGIKPAESIAIPLVVNSVALLIFYGDTGAHGAPVGVLSEFEVLMLQAGLAMEKALLEKRIKQFKGLRTTH